MKTLGLVLRLAARNVRRNPRRTLLDMAAFVVCLSMIAFFVGVYRFRIVDGVTKATRYRTGHLQVHARGYDAVARRLPLAPALADPGPILLALRGLPGARLASERIRFPGSLSRGQEQLRCQGVAFDPEREEAFSLLPERIQSGRYLRGSDAGVLLTERLARLLAVEPGQTVRLKAQSVYDVPNIVEAEVVGIVRPPFSAVDQATFFIPLPFARELLDMPDGATEVLVALQDPDAAPAALRVLPGLLGPELAAATEAFDWRHYEPALVADIAVDTRFLTLFFGVLLLISTFIMSNSMSMTVFERTRELGTLRAVGMSRNAVLALVSAESALVGALGALAGCLLGALLCWYFGIHGIPTDVGELSSTPVSPRFYPISRPVEYVGCAVLGVTAGWLGGLRGALRARRLRIVEALRD
jgi:putative ABC transport system permease protein